MELWHIGFGAGVFAVFAFFMVALALASRDYNRFKQEKRG